MSMWKRNFAIACYLVVVTLGVSPTASAQDCPAHLPQWTIAFVNGINTTESAAMKSAQAIANTVAARGGSQGIYQGENICLEFEYSYNHNEELYLDLVDSAGQKLGDEIGKIFSYLGNIEPLPDWFQQQLSDISVRATAGSYLLDSDLKGFVERYESLLSNGRRLVLIAHSQGNFYANEAYQRLLLGSHGQNPVDIIGIATPADTVLGSPARYSTFRRDPIWKVPGALSWNVDDPACGGGLTSLVSFSCHFFLTAYWDRLSTRERVLSHLWDIVTPRNALPISRFTMVAGASVADEFETLVVWSADGLPVLVTFDSTGSVDPDGAIVRRLWTIDGVSHGSSTVAQHGFGPGVHVVQLTVTDSGGARATSFGKVDVRTAAPMAIPVVGSGGQTVRSGGTLNVALQEDVQSAVVTFSADESTSVGQITEWLWSLNGSRLQEGSVFSRELHAGRYVVSLIVRDSFGRYSLPATATINVVAPSLQARYVTDVGDNVVIGGARMLSTGSIVLLTNAAGTAAVRIRAIAPTGELLWVYPASSEPAIEIGGSMVVGSDDRTYLTAGDTIHAVDRGGVAPSGWPVTIGPGQGQGAAVFIQSVTPRRDGGIFVSLLASDDLGSVLALAANGSTLWRREFAARLTEGGVGRMMVTAFSGDDVFVDYYPFGRSGVILGLDGLDGHEICRGTLPDTASTLVQIMGTSLGIFAVFLDGYNAPIVVKRFQQDCTAEEWWTKPVDGLGFGFGPPAVDDIIVANENRHLVAVGPISSRGALLWRNEGVEVIDASRNVVVRNGQICLIGTDAFSGKGLFLFTMDLYSGALLSSTPLGGPLAGVSGWSETVVLSNGGDIYLFADSRMYKME